MAATCQFRKKYQVSFNIHSNLGKTKTMKDNLSMCGNVLILFRVSTVKQWIVRYKKIPNYTLSTELLFLVWRIWLTAILFIKHCPGWCFLPSLTSPTSRHVKLRRKEKDENNKRRIHIALMLITISISTAALFWKHFFTCTQGHKPERNKWNVFAFSHVKFYVDFLLCWR